MEMTNRIAQNDSPLTRNALHVVGKPSGIANKEMIPSVTK